MRSEPSRRGEGQQRRLHVTGRLERNEGVTTALLDLALANGRRGEQVVFWCRDAPEMQRVYRVAADLMAQGNADMDSEFSPTALRIRWPSTDRGLVQFACEANRMQMRGFRATVVVMDGDYWTDPEPVHAHTIIVG